MRWSLLAAALMAAGCAVEPVDLSDKRCPCGPGFECDDAADRCVPRGAGCDPLVRAESFEHTWTTSNVIRWAWEPVGAAEDLVRYEVEIAERPEDLGTDAARRIGPDDNPELGGYVLPRAGDADEVVTSTMTFGHQPGRTYVARLWVTDTAFCTYRTPMRAAQTQIHAAEEIVLYRDERPDPGFPVPSELAVVDDGTGNLVTEHVPSRDVDCVRSGEGVCSQNLRWSGLERDASTIRGGNFASLAMLEVTVTNDTDTPSFYSRFWLRLSDDRLFQIEPFTIPSSPTPRVFQVPLTALVCVPDPDRDPATAPVCDPVPLAHEDLQAFAVDEIDVGGQWSRCGPGESPECFGGRVLVDEARIRH